MFSINPGLRTQWFCNKCYKKGNNEVAYRDIAIKRKIEKMKK